MFQRLVLLLAADSGHVCRVSCVPRSSIRKTCSTCLINFSGGRGKTICLISEDGFVIPCFVVYRRGTDFEHSKIFQVIFPVLSGLIASSTLPCKSCSIESRAMDQTAAKMDRYSHLRATMVRIQSSTKWCLNISLFLAYVLASVRSFCLFSGLQFSKLDTFLNLAPS